MLIDYSVKRWAGDMTILGGSVNGVERFETWFGVIFLIIILLSPGGLMGIWTSITGRLERAARTRSTDRSAAAAGR